MNTPQPPTGTRTPPGAGHRPVRIGVQIAPQHASYETIRQTAADLEDLGVDILFNWDHFYPLSGEPDGLHFESWTMLAALAEQTTRVEIGALVNCHSYRNANLQADMARTIDHISAKGGTGRFIFGTGSGWFERDYDEYGYTFGTAGSRLDALAAGLPVIEDRWARLNPPPTRRIPVLIGGGGEKKTLRIVAQHADIWHSFSDAATLERKLGILAEHGSAVGRDVAEIEISTEIGSRSLSEVEEHHALGATLFTIGISGPVYDISAVPDWLAWRDEKNAQGAPA
jgi:probable F420-dependent oxidoreductase